MKKTFTQHFIYVTTSMLILTGFSIPVSAQFYTAARTVNQGDYVSAMTQDASGNLYEIRYSNGLSQRF